MDENRKNSQEDKSPHTDSEKKNRLTLHGIFYHNTFVLIFSFCVALISWFVLAAGNENTNRLVTDVPIEVKLSIAAEEGGIRVFNMSYDTADLEISGSNLITNKLTEEDFEVSVNLNLTSAKLTGNTLQKTTVQVRAAKKSAIADYNIVSINPEEITVEYDRYKEVTFPIEHGDIQYSAASDFYPGTPTFSAEAVTVSGPESSVNKISRAAVSYTLNDPLRSDASFTCPVRLFDQNNREITDISAMYLETDVDTVEVVIPVLSKKTVTLIPTTLHRPQGFSDTRITVEPGTIDIAGDASVLAGINEIQLETPIDFADIGTSQKNRFTMDIPLPAGVQNISAVGENTVSQATVTVNTSGFVQSTVTVYADNFQIVNRPAGKDVTVDTQQLKIIVMGSEGQSYNVTGDVLSVQLDLTNFADRTGSVRVPATIVIGGSGTDTCWVLGEYFVLMQISDRAAMQERTIPANAPAGDSSSSNDGVAAQPQE